MEVKEAFVGFAKPSVAVDTVILRVVDKEKTDNRQIPDKEVQVLLIKKITEDKWHLPGTILKLGEEPEEAIKRIVNSKTGISGIEYEQLYTVTDPLRDERGHVISIVYIGKVQGVLELSVISEYQAVWKSVHRLGELRYGHNKIVEDTMERIRGKLIYSDIGFEFVDKEFTIKELEKVYVALGEKPIPAFRRIMTDRIEDTGKISEGKAFRPAKLYRKKEGALC